MIDLHCHMLPAIDDGARDLDTALRMAELAVADGITLTACTPHINPGLFDNTHEAIRRAVDAFRDELNKADIPLELTYGADIQVVPDMAERLQDGTLPTLNGSRYLLFEPPHTVPLPRIAELMQRVQAAGFVPVITHPERLTYIERHYDEFVAMARAGAWIQLTGGSLLGRFGRRVQGMTERFLKDGITHLLASDGHNLTNRTPELGEARDAAARIVGEEEAQRLVQGRPAAVVADRDPDEVPLPAGLAGGAPRVEEEPVSRGWLGRLLGRGE